MWAVSIMCMIDSMYRSVINRTIDMYSAAGVPPAWLLAAFAWRETFTCQRELLLQNITCACEKRLNHVSKDLEPFVCKLAAANFPSLH